MKEQIKQSFKTLRDRYRRFSSSKTGQRVKTYASYLLQFGVIGFIIYQLTDIGWGKFFSSLPVHPVYYGLFLFIYFLLPLTEALAYRKCWNIPYFRSLPIFLKKRIYNKDVMGYSGEVVLLGWAKKLYGFSDRKLFRDIRDNNIVSSAASTFIALLVLLVFVVTGQIRLFSFLAETSLVHYAIAGVILVILGGVAYRFRKYLFSMSFPVARYIFSIHSVRMLMVYVAQIFQWYIVMPEISLDVWFTFLSINILISRIPLIPSLDFVATGTNIEVAKLIQVPVAEVAGLLLVHDVLNKVLNALFYLVFMFRDEQEPGEIPGKESEPADKPTR